MELYQQLLINILEKEEIHIIFPNLNIDAKEIVELQSYRALLKIKAIIDDDCLTDTECFARIEEIVSVFERMGSNGGFRHDF